MFWELFIINPASLARFVPLLLRVPVCQSAPTHEHLPALGKRTTSSLPCYVQGIHRRRVEPSSAISPCKGHENKPETPSSPLANLCAPDELRTQQAEGGAASEALPRERPAGAGAGPLRDVGTN